jgi:penicillin-binding protein 2
MANTADQAPLLRLTFLSVLVISLFLALFSRLWFLQVLAGDRYVELADSNRLRTVVTEAPRGGIFASDGEELVKNRSALTISADRQILLDPDGQPRDDEAARVVRRLSELLLVDEASILERMVSRRYSPFRPVPIAFDVAPEIVFAIREHQELFTGVIAEELPVRQYPRGRTAAHLVGFLNEISETELADPAFADYRGGDLIGRAGLEQTYEADLRGISGQRVLVVNAQGNVLDVQSEREPIQGNDLLTTIDLDLQEATERLLEEGIIASREIQRDDGQFLPSVAGSAVIMDPRDGSILAMASWPTYDPREFVGGLSSEYAEFLYLDPDAYQPAINRAIQGRYPPGSVFKTASGAAMLEAGLVGPRTRVDCPPAFEVGNITFRNWNRGVNEGAMDLSDALMRSCDTYFYELAYNQWVREQRQLAEVDDDVSRIDEVLSRVARGFGFGRLLGIDLPSEASGAIPDRRSKQERWIAQRDSWCAQADVAESGSYLRAVLEDNCAYGGQWRGGDAVNTSIGQGEILTTPLQVAASYAAVANGGTLWQPRVGRAILAPDGEVVRDVEPVALGELPVDAAGLAVIHEGLERVVMNERGTARGAFAGFPLDRIAVAGKTGTAELKPRVPYAWFAAYAPVGAPEIVVVVNVEEGGGGSQTAAPIARNILEHYFGIVRAEEAEFEAGPELLD